jgi:hypothetical protein
MASNSTKWLIGCGIGCLGFMILAGAVLGGGFLCVRSAINTIQETEQSQKDLEELYGGIGEYVPAHDGSIQSSRMEAFLSVRSALTTMHHDLTKTFQSFPHESFRDRAPSAREVLKIVKSATGFLPLIARYIQTRNRALMDIEMGFGEYFYIYTITYHSWLGFSPDDRPEDVRQKTGRSDDVPEIELFDEDSSFGREEAWRRYNRFVLTILRNQLEAMPADFDILRDSPWRTRLEHEIGLLESDHDRTPWQDGLPESIERSLLPYRSQLEDTYCRAANVFDLFAPEDGDWDFTFDGD